jgi:hypothetical protein
MNLIKKNTDKLRRSPLLIKPVVRGSKIDNLKDAVEYLNKKKRLTTIELRDIMTEQVIYDLKLFGYIKRTGYCR